MKRKEETTNTSPSGGGCKEVKSDAAKSKKQKKGLSQTHRIKSKSRSESETESDKHCEL